MQERLQKLIAQAGIASRRQAEELIKSGLVTVNGEIAELGTKADPETDHIKLNGKLINAKLGHRKNVYLLLNKPKGVLSSVTDPEGRTLVTDLVKGYGKLHPVGRLDFQSEGLIILTNDGDFTQKVAGSKKVAKIYEVKVKGLPNENAINKLRRGVVLDDGFKTAPCEIKILAPTQNNAWYEITLYEGHNQQIRKMFDSVGHSVVKLRRIAIGNIREEKMPIGAHRELTAKEIKELLSPYKKSAPKSKEEAPDKPKLEKHSRALKPKKPKKKKKPTLSAGDIARAKATRRG
jgi:23S rRNA pseudouridine2605 synthase